MTASARFALVGPEFERSENLALRVLAAALHEAGHEPAIVPLVVPEQFEPAAEAIAALQPHAVGVSIACEGSAWLLGALPARLRTLGVRGPIVAGGAFATLHASELLHAQPAFDAVVRHDGEAAVVRLAEVSLGRGSMLDVPGALVREGDRVVDGAACAFVVAGGRAWRGPWPLARHLGLAAADLVTSRGCSESCAYCCLAALRADAASRCADPALSRAVAGVRRRDPEQVADEMADLAQRLGAAIFQLQDDSFLPSDPTAALATIEALREGLEARGVVRRAFAVKVRPDALEPRVCAALGRLGVVRAFVGVEALEHDLARALGRRAPRPAAALGESLRGLRRAGVAPYFNSLCIGPDASLEQVERELGALDRLTDTPFEIARVIAYAGTALERRLRAQGRLSGCAFVRRYAFADARVAELAAAMERIATRHFGKRCPAKRVADLEYNLALAARFFRGARLGALLAETRALVSRIGRDQVATARALTALVRAGARADSPGAASIAMAAMRFDAEAVARVDALARGLEAEVARAGAQSPRAFFRGQVALPAAFAAAMALAGCGGSAENEQTLPAGGGGSAGADASADASADAGSGGAADGGAEKAPDAPGADATDGAPEPAAETGPDAPADVPAEVAPDVAADQVAEDGQPDGPAADATDAPKDLGPPDGPTCELLSESVCSTSTHHTVPTMMENLSVKKYVQKCGEAGYFKATVKVDGHGCGVLTALETLSGPVDPNSALFKCVADLIAHNNLFCFVGETIVFEDQGPPD